MEASEDAPYSEACYRTIVSRAYYGVFCRACSLANDLDHVSFHSDSHQKLQEHFLAHPHDVRKRLGNRLRNLHQFRKKADYDEDLREDPINTAKKALALAKRIEGDIEVLVS
jgi:uncharacterized protein (UPF0332 family)